MVRVFVSSVQKELDAPVLIPMYVESRLNDRQKRIMMQGHIQCSVSTARVIDSLTLSRALPGEILHCSWAWLTERVGRGLGRYVSACGKNESTDNRPMFIQNRPIGRHAGIDKIKDGPPARTMAHAGTAIKKNLEVLGYGE